MSAVSLTDHTERKEEYVPAGADPAVPVGHLPLAAGGLPVGALGLVAAEGVVALAVAVVDADVAAEVGVAVRVLVVARAHEPRTAVPADGVRAARPLRARRALLVPVILFLVFLLGNHIAIRVVIQFF